MADNDLEQLLAPVSEEAPTGENLEYDPKFSELERTAAGSEERYSGGELIPAEEPDWKVVRALAIELFARTKDLRVAVQFARAETALSGIPGLANGVAVIRAIVERYWEDMHPKLEAEDDFDPVFRINALAPLSAPAGLLGVVRKTYLVEARSVGRFTFRELDIVEDRATAPEGSTAPTAELLRAALREAGSDYAQVQFDHLQQVRDDLSAIETVFREQARGGQTPDIEGLRDEVGFGIAFLKTGIKQPETAEAGAETGEAGAQGADAGGAGSGSVGGLRSREDVKRILEQVCDFLQRTEPSNPAPLLIMRAHRLIDRSFVDIIQDLAPDALTQITQLSGSPPAEGG